MIHNPMRAEDAQRKKGVMERLVNWLTRKTDVDISNHLFPTFYD